MFGILNVNKPSGPTSRDCVNRIERAIRPVKCGHAGTLDPIASGVLLVMLGQAVRLTDAIHALPKEYLGHFQLGVSSESLDIESELTDVANAPLLDEADLIRVLPSFTGNIEQIPPRFSAVWIDGKRAHELARQGKEFDVPKRRITIHRLELVSFNYPNFALRVQCSTGTYIRTLASDIARTLSSDAIMTGLQRVSVGPFELDDSIELDQLLDSDRIRQSLIPARQGIEHMPQAFPSECKLLQLIQGKSISQEDLRLSICNEVSDTRVDYAAVINEAGQLKALVKRLGNGFWRADKCFEVDEYLRVH
jgi:tRNA pseudouridine55 synthase